MASTSSAKQRLAEERRRNPELVAEKEKAQKEYKAADEASAGKIYQEGDIPVRKTEGGKYGNPSSKMLRGAGPSDYRINEALEKAGAK